MISWERGGCGVSTRSGGSPRSFVSSLRKFEYRRLTLSAAATLVASDDEWRMSTRNRRSAGSPRAHAMSGHALRRQKTASRWYWLQVRIHDEPSVENVEICSVYYCSISSNEYLFSRHFGTRLAISDFSRMAVRLLTSALETPSSSAEPARLGLRTTTRNIRILQQRRADLHV